MPFVCAERLGFSYMDRVSLFEDVSFRLSPGWYGLVGANGLGKTTLARLMAGELKPTCGRLWLEPREAKVVICRQELRTANLELFQFAQRPEREAAAQRGILNLEPTMLLHWETLSPGERKRWQIGAALAEEPELLILDEPTNHLDSIARNYLIHALRRFRGVGIAISHDRELLATLTTATLRVQSGSVQSLALSYAEARETWQADVTRRNLVRHQLMNQHKELQERIHVARCDQRTAQKQRSAGARMKNTRDHDASSFAKTGRAANGEARISRRLRVMATELDRSGSNIPEFVVDRTIGRSVFLDYESAPKPRILQLDGEDLYAGKRLILRDVRVFLERHTRTRLSGPNGAGKTTLIRALLARSTSSEHLLYLPQELCLEEIGRLQAAVRELSRTERGRIMSIVAALGIDPERLQGSLALSPGEARKLKLALGLATHAWALILDEPTNHLDLPSVERLEAALVAFPGAILLVTHDTAFAKALTDQIWEIQGQRVSCQ